LADVVCLGAGHDCRFETQAGTGVPVEDGEGMCAGPAFESEFFLGLIEWRASVRDRRYGESVRTILMNGFDVTKACGSSTV
jgi:hypothetical protein